jgi:hypothetical protein
MLYYTGAWWTLLGNRKSGKYNEALPHDKEFYARAVYIRWYYIRREPPIVHVPFHTTEEWYVVFLIDSMDRKVLA